MTGRPVSQPAGECVQVDLAGGVGRVHDVVDVRPWRSNQTDPVEDHQQATTACGLRIIVGERGDTQALIDGPATCGRCQYVGERQAVNRARRGPGQPVRRATSQR